MNVNLSKFVTARHGNRRAAPQYRSEKMVDEKLILNFLVY